MPACMQAGREQQRRARDAAAALAAVEAEEQMRRAQAELEDQVGGEERGPLAALRCRGPRMTVLTCASAACVHWMA